MRLVWMSDPRPGQKVQCCKCYKMIGADHALADLDGKSHDFYHPHCVPRSAALPPRKEKWGVTRYIDGRRIPGYLETFDREEDARSETIRRSQGKHGPRTSFSYGIVGRRATRKAPRLSR